MLLSHQFTCCVGNGEGSNVDTRNDWVYIRPLMVELRIYCFVLVRFVFCGSYCYRLVDSTYVCLAPCAKCRCCGKYCKTLIANDRTHYSTKSYIGHDVACLYHDALHSSKLFFATCNTYKVLGSKHWPDLAVLHIMYPVFYQRSSC